MLGPLDDWLIGEGAHVNLYDRLGAHAIEHDGIAGVRFAVWAPNAERVSVVGDFNRWDGRRHPMRVRGASGVWELFIPGLREALYKYEIRNRHSGALRLKTDPFAREHEVRPATASRIRDTTPYRWQDDTWLDRRRSRDWLHEPLSIYEVHFGSWRRNSDGRSLSYRQAAEQLVPYVLEQGFTPRRVPAPHRVPARRVLGLPGCGLLCPDQPLRISG